MGARETLAARRVRETRYPIWIADPTDAAPELQEAKARLLIAGIGKAPDDPVVASQQAAVDVAEAKLEECREWLVFHGLADDAFEELVQAHPPVEGADPDDVYNEATFIPALIVACAQDSDLTAAEWSAELVKLTSAERRELTDEVMAANTRTWSAALPKG